MPTIGHDRPLGGSAQAGSHSLFNACISPVIYGRPFTETHLKLQMFINWTLRNFFAALLLLPLVCSAAPSSVEGTWKEVDDPETSSTLRFEKVGDSWVGKYLSVSSHQADYGYRAGDTIIRGRFEGSTFRGEVLLKTVDADPACPDMGAGWTDVKLEMVRKSQRLHGSYVETLVDENDECKVVGTGLRQYRLERVR